MINCSTLDGCVINISYITAAFKHYCTLSNEYIAPCCCIAVLLVNTTEQFSLNVILLLIAKDIAPSCCLAMLYTLDLPLSQILELSDEMTPLVLCLHFTHQSNSQQQCIIQATAGGGIYSNKSIIKFDNKCNVSFCNNSVTTDAGAIYQSHSKIFFKMNAAMLFANNSAYSARVFSSVGKGGTVVCNDSLILFEDHSITAFSDNRIASYGGAVYAITSTNGSSTVMFSNSNTWLGEAVYIMNSNITFQGYSIIALNNNVAAEGGAVYARNSLITLLGIYK